MIVIEESPELVQQYLDECDSFFDVLLKLNMNTRGYYYKILYDYISKHNLNTDKLIQNRNKESGSHLTNARYKRSIKYEDMFVENCKHGRNVVKKHIARNNLLVYICKKCGNTGEWNGEKLVLQLEHINGKNDDNRLDNLCYLCPNCHSQTATFCGRSCRKNVCKECKAYIKSGSVRCLDCNKIYLEKVGKKHLNKKPPIPRIKGGKPKPKKERPSKFSISKEDLEELIKVKTYTEIGKIYGVSDNAIKKRCKKLGIVLENRLGYWTKVKYGKI
jgi:hypothetical protein